MIGSYRDKRTRTFARGERVTAFQGFKKQAEKRLEILDAADSLNDLAVLPATDLKHYPVTGRGSTVSVLTGNGEFVLNGPGMDLKMLR